MQLSYGRYQEMRAITCSDTGGHGGNPNALACTLPHGEPEGTGWTGRDWDEGFRREAEMDVPLF